LYSDTAWVPPTPAAAALVDEHRNYNRQKRTKRFVSISIFLDWIRMIGTYHPFINESNAAGVFFFFV
jgi:hypothetical protein